MGPHLKLKPAWNLSILIAALAALASFGGLFLAGLYRDNDFVQSTWLGNDVVTLFLAVPILAGALIFARRGSLRAQLVWMGMLDYLLYNYAFYLFGAAFNAFFLLYVALFGLSIFALIFGLANLDANGIAEQFHPRTPVRLIAGYMLVVAAGLTTVYLAQSIGFIVTGDLPSIVARSGHPTSIVFALDLTLLIPFFALGAVWIVQCKPWGYVLAGITLVKGSIYTLVLSLNSLWATKAVLPDAAGEAPLWVTLTGLGLLAVGLLYRNMIPSRKAL
jgi:hypothetical protein